MPLVHVAVAVISRDDKVLIARRSDHAHQGGLWEFPGGKVERNETVQQALKRELKEELDIDLNLNGNTQPLIRIRHDYGDKAVLLDVWVVTQFTGKAKGAEGQPIKWVKKTELAEYDFPEANKPILAATLLPQKYLITGNCENVEDCLYRLESSILVNGIKLVQFRNHDLYRRDYNAYIDFAKQIKRLCDNNGVCLVLNAQPEILKDIDADGVHLSYAESSRHAVRPVPANKRFGVSCHNAEEVASVRHLEPDYIFLSPVKPTSSHPGAASLGWDLFQETADYAPFPVYALGGMGEVDLNEAICHGAQGIAAISSWW